MMRSVADHFSVCTKQYVQCTLLLVLQAISYIKCSMLTVSPYSICKRTESAMFSAFLCAYRFDMNEKNVIVEENRYTEVTLIYISRFWNYIVSNCTVFELILRFFFRSLYKYFNCITFF